MDCWSRCQYCLRHETLAVWFDCYTHREWDDDFEPRRTLNFASELSSATSYGRLCDPGLHHLSPKCEVICNSRFMDHVCFWLLSHGFPFGWIERQHLTGFLWVILHKRNLIAFFSFSGITTVLTMTFMGLEARKDLPKVTYPTALDYFVFISFMYIFSTVVQVI